MGLAEWSVIAHGSYFLGSGEDPSDVDVLVVTGERGLTREGVAAEVAGLLPREALALPLDVSIAHPDALTLMERAAILGGRLLAGPPLDVPPIGADEWARGMAATALAVREPGAAALCAVRALWASEGRVVLPKSAVVAEAAGGPWGDLAAKAWPHRRSPAFTHPDLDRLLEQMPALAVPTDELTDACRRFGGKAAELAQTGVAWLPGTAQPWLPGGARDGERPSSLFTWWEPPDRFALGASECASLVEHLGPIRSADDAPWRCEAWFSAAPPDVAGAVEERVTFANDLWWRLDVAMYSMVVHRYGPGKGHPEHFDMAPGSMTRKLAASVQLSDPDDYEGGDLELLIHGTWHPCPRTRGTVVVLPGWVSHRVRPVTAGERYSLVVMGYGPPIR